MITDAQYSAWLLRDVTRAVLLEADAYSGGSVVTRYVSNVAFTSLPSDTPANINYEDRLRTIPSFNAQLSELFTGSSIPSWGDLEIINDGGTLDSWLNDAWDGRALKLYLGDPSWAKDDFRLILDGTCADIYAKDRTTLALKIRDKSFRLNVALQTNLIGGSTVNAGNPVPICYGECFNVEPVLIDAGTSKYQVHDGAIHDITDVRDNGVSVSYTKDLTHGCFTLSAAPVGRITADVQGALATYPTGVAGNYLTMPAQWVWDLVRVHSTLTDAEIDAVNLIALNTTCPQTLGLYVRDRDNLMSVLDQILTAVGGFWTFSRDGLLRVGRLEAPSGTPVLSLVADDVGENGLSIIRRDLPVQTYRVGWKKNWTIQADGLAGSVTEANRAAYAADYSVSSSTNSGITTSYLLAQNPDLDGTLIASGSDGSAEASRLATLWGQVRSVYQVNCYAAPFTVNLGDVISLDHPRFGFSGGQLAVVVGISERATGGRATLQIWK